MKDKLYFVQDKRSFVGNDVLWWAKDGMGYTTDLSKAEIYTEEEVNKQFLGDDRRGTDVVWPYEYIIGLTRLAVDHQYLDYKKIVKVCIK